MKSLRPFVLRFVVVVALFVGAAYWQRIYFTEDIFMPPRSLVNATNAQIADVVLRRVMTTRPSEGIPAAVVFVRRVTLEDLAAIGLDPIKNCANPPPYALVILQGNFNLGIPRGGIRTYSPDAGVRRAYEIAYVVDLRAGTPVNIATSSHSMWFRNIVLHPWIFPAPTADPSTLSSCPAYDQIAPPAIATPLGPFDPYEAYPLPVSTSEGYPAPVQVQSAYPVPKE